MDNSFYSEPELAEYRACPQISFMGSHIAGLSNCIFCAEVFRRYRRKQGNLEQVLGTGGTNDLDKDGAETSVGSAPVGMV